MKYIGSKSKTGKAIAAILNQHIDASSYIEPFMGSLSVAKHVTIRPKILNNIHPELADMYIRAFNDGDWIPDKNHVTREEYYEIKSAGPSHPYYAIVGFACSFRGKWWGGYAAPQYGTRKDGRKWSSDINNLTAAKKSILSCKAGCGDATFTCLSYDEIPITHNSVIYCDPPYRNTTGYPGTPKFDSDKFWEWAEFVSHSNYVYVSEAEAPPNWTDIMSVTIDNVLGNGNTNTSRTEKLFVLNRG